jgi:hypothetical protein
MHDDGVGAVSSTRNDDPFDVVAGVPLPVPQALAAGVEPLIAVIGRAAGSDDLQVQVVDQGFGRGQLTRTTDPGQSDALGAGPGHVERHVVHPDGTGVRRVGPALERHQHCLPQ